MTVAIRFELGKQRSEGGTQQTDKRPARTANHATSDSSTRRWCRFINRKWCQWWFPGRLTQTREQLVGVGSGAQ